ncbi:hypothetical protein ASG93_13945 [Paenibacillus sp. Soil787]|nr:hypothetical protein ASG93_13945 [Paenibacillus sp. Soil787]
MRLIVWGVDFMVNDNKLTEVDIEFILNAIDTSKEALMKVYTKDWLETKIDVIKNKLDAQQKELEQYQ